MLFNNDDKKTYKKVIFNLSFICLLLFIAVVIRLAANFIVPTDNESVSKLLDNDMNVGFITLLIDALKLATVVLPIACLIGIAYRFFKNMANSSEDSKSLNKLVGISVATIAVCILVNSLIVIGIAYLGFS